MRTAAVVLLLFCCVAALAQVGGSLAGLSYQPADIKEGIVADWDFYQPAIVNVLDRGVAFESGWNASGLTITSASSTTDPLGFKLGSLLTEGAGTVTPQFYQQTIQASGTWTASVYMMAGTRSWAALRFGAASKYAWFNLATGTVGTVESGLTAAIANAGGGWYRLSVSVTSSTPDYFVIQMAAADGGHSYTGNGSTEYVFGAQVNAGALTDYQPLSVYRDAYGNALSLGYVTDPTFVPYLATGSTVTGPYTFSQSLPMTVVAIFNTTATGTEQDLFRRTSGGVTLMVHQTGKLQFCVSFNCLLATGVFSGAPVVASVTYDGTTVNIYKNGQLDTSASLSGTFAAGTGMVFGPGGIGWTGSVHRLRFYNRILAATELLHLTDYFRGKYNHYGTPVALTTAATRSLTTAKRQHMARQLGAFYCYNMSTYTVPLGNQWDAGNRDPNLFAPTALNIDQWLDVAVAGGAKYVAFTNKHVDGFAMWPTAVHAPGYPPYSIAQSSWYAANGNQDITGLFISKAKARGLHPGIYLSIWDLTWEIRTGTTAASGTAAYIAMIKAQLSELLTNYGDLEYILFDGWNDVGPTVTTPGDIHGGVGNFTYITAADIYSHIRAIQPNILILNDNQSGQADAPFDVPVLEAPYWGFPEDTRGLPVELWDVVRSWFYDGTGTLQTSAQLSARLNFAINHNYVYNLNVSINQAGVVQADEAAAFAGITH